jgi:hypothetical protein
VYQQPLQRHSLYFRKALSGDWLETQSGVWELPEVTEDAFGMFIHWTYTGTALAVLDSKLDSYVVKAWALGDHLQSEGFKNAMVNMLFNEWVEPNDTLPARFETVVEAYALTPPAAKLRKLFIDYLALKLQSDDISPDILETVPADLVLDLIRSMTVLREVLADCTGNTTNWLFIQDICLYYHEHREGRRLCTTEEMQRTFATFTYPAEPRKYAFASEH